MTFSRALLRINVVLFGVYGLAYLIAPDMLSGILTGASFPNATSAIDVRAIYGGMALGITTFVWLLSRGSVDSQKIGQIGCAVAFGCVALGRIIGFIVTGSSGLFMELLLASEILFCGLSCSALRTLR
jgi:hypothetical protein